LLAVAALAAPSTAQAQAPAADVDRGTLTLNTSRFQVKVEWRTTLGVIRAPQPPARDEQTLYYFSDRNFELIQKSLAGSECSEHPFLPRILCPKHPVKRVVIKLGPLADELKIKAEVPKLPKMSSVQAGKGDDSVKGGRSAEAIDLGKGEDKAKGGGGNDRIDARDGERDVINGGAGRDVAVVDRKDKVKNVEVVKRR
jgi:hypothetical protein